MTEVRIEYLHPKEIEERMAVCPTLFQAPGHRGMARQAEPCRAGRAQGA